MAAKIDNKELKRRALLSLAEGRSELTAQAERIRTEMNPGLVARRIFKEHTGTVVLTTVAVGLVVTALIVRNRKRADSERPSWRERQARDHHKEPSASMLGTLARALTPALIKFAVIKPLDQFFARQRQDVSDHE